MKLAALTAPGARRLATVLRNGSPRGRHAGDPAEIASKQCRTP